MVAAVRFSKCVLAASGPRNSARLCSGGHPCVSSSRWTVALHSVHGVLDSRSGKEVMAILGELNCSGQTVFLVTHDERLAT